jgi:hypothetical protein
VSAAFLDLLEEPVPIFASFFVACWSYPSLSVVLLRVSGCHVCHLVEFSHGVEIISSANKPNSDLSLNLGGAEVTTPKNMACLGTSNP